MVAKVGQHLGIFCPYIGVYSLEMNDDFITTADFGSLLGVKPRRARQILAEAAAVGFQLEADRYGTRLVPRPLAFALKAAHAAGRDVAALRLDVSLHAFLARDARAVEPDAIDVLIYTAAEVAIVREAVGALTAAAGGLNGGDYQAPAWTNLGLPDPRLGL